MVRTTNKQRLIILVGAAVAVSLFVFAFSGPFGTQKSPSTAKLPTDSPVISSQPAPAQSSTDKSMSTQSSSEKPAGATYPTENTYARVYPKTSTFQDKSGESFPLRTYKPFTVNDPSGQQWWTTSTGLDTAWNIGSGTTQTVVAVIDTGFALQHEEFTKRWALNTGEQGSTTSEAPSKLNCTDRGLPISQSCNLIDDDFDGIVDNEIGTATRENPSQLNCSDASLPLDKSCNMIDDDNNGYVDDVSGWDFANFDASVQAGQTNPDGNGTQHATAVTGVLAATGNNNKGIAGVNWSTKVLPLQALDDDSYGNTLTVARAIYYAADRGVDVINLSLGSVDEDPYLRQAIDYAIDRDVIVVAASGNDGCDCISYPAQYPEVIAVGAQNQSGSPSTFSNYGAQLDILAPGEGMTTPHWSKTLPSTGYASNMAGTSFAAPYVSGLLSLARSHQPTAKWGELFNALLATANHGNLTAMNPSSHQLGSGYAQANTFMARTTTPDTPIIRYTFSPTPITSTLSSALSYQCMSANDFPTASLFEIASTSSIYYTIDALERLRATNRGDSVTYIARTCVGLPTDAPSTIRRINLLSEIKNIQSGKGW